LNKLVWYMVQHKTRCSKCKLGIDSADFSGSLNRNFSGSFDCMAQLEGVLLDTPALFAVNHVFSRRRR
jgi:hypothetical protein